jgi:PAS domain S-box-containing protein
MDEELLNNCAVLIDSEQKRRKAERQYRDLLNNMVDGYAVHEIILDAQGEPVDCRFLAVNPSFERLAGMKAQDLVGKTFLEVFPETKTFWIQACGRVARTGKAMMFDRCRNFDHNCTVTLYQTAHQQCAVIYTDVSAVSLSEKNESDTDVAQMDLFPLVREHIGLSVNV